MVPASHRTAGQVLTPAIVHPATISLQGIPAHIACWNVRSHRDEGVQYLTMHTLLAYRVEVACLSEVSLPASGHKEINVPHADATYQLYYSGVQDNTGRHGVALALSAAVNAALLDWAPIFPRLARVRIKGAVANIIIIAVYASTLNAADDIKNDFEADLQDAVDEIPARDILVVAGDWNARTGPADESTCHLLGRFALGNRCSNGERLVEFASTNRPVVSSTCFQHRRRHL